MIFLKEDEQKKYRENIEYEKKLVNHVVENVRLRFYGSSFFRQKQMTSGDRFLYFNLPYDLFVICIRANEILVENKSNKMPYFSFFSKIMNMCLSALSLLENNFVDNTYPICRGIIELFSIYLGISSNKNVLEKYNYLTQIETNHSQCGLPYPAEFLDLYNNRLNKKEDKKTAFLNFGWVDDIENYHRIVQGKPYTIDGLIQYLNKTYPELEAYDYSSWYKKCNHYTHASIISTYPLLAYFEISIMLYSTIPFIYKEICDYAKIKPDINGIDILNRAKEDFQNLVEQYNNRSTENFQQYYFSKNNF